MRQYRGFTKEGKEVRGYYFADDEEGKGYIVRDIDCTGGLLRHDQRYGYFISDFIEVLPTTIGQSTGLKSKSGKEIYEGDRIKGTEHENYSEEKRPDLWDEYIVRFGKGEVDASDFEQYEVEILGFYLERVKPCIWAAPSILELTTIEITGTIHDKELGKGKVNGKEVQKETV